MTKTTRSEVRNRSERLEELFEAHRDRLYALAVRMAVAGDEAADLVQETFLRAARARRIPAGDNAEPWLVRILVNLCRDRYRRRAFRGLQRRRISRTAVGSAHSAESAVAARAAVRAALATLPARRRAIVVLRELEDRDTAEIAALLGVSAVTVRWHLSQARKQLREALVEVRK